MFTCSAVPALLPKEHTLQGTIASDVPLHLTGTVPVMALDATCHEKRKSW